MRSRYARGSDSDSATAFKDVGWPGSWRPSWISRRTPYSAFVVKNIRGKAYHRGRSSEGGLRPRWGADPLLVRERVEHVQPRGAARRQRRREHAGEHRDDDEGGQ